ncbi:MAG: LPXTG cell wall anchor domain-containing protein, partial [Ruminococcus sp.]|nr:LPXTG cell wall anchor domain-containing protein [Ruminococcus sp.]
YFKDQEGKTETTVEAEKLPLAAHSFTKQDTSEKYLKSAATCTSKAVYYYSCEVCGEKGTETFEYGELDKSNHVGDTEIVGSKAATCDEDGYTGDTVCKSCGETIEKGKVIPATGHTYSEEWSHDDESHWRECTVGCGTIIDKAAHTGGEATCVKKAVCDVCGTEYGEINPDNHTNTEIRNAKEASCAEEGYTGDTYCTDCGELIETGEVIPKTEHKHTEIRNAKEATCAEEGYTGDTYCTDCGELIETGEVIPKTNVHKNTEIRGYIAPTVDSEGYTGDTYCLDCGELIKYGEVIPAHVHQLKKIEAVAATHFAAGNIEYYVCEEDGMKFADAEGTIPLTDEEIEIPVIAHSFGEDWKYDETEHWRECECGEKAYVADHTFGEWTVVRSATEDAEGLEERRCSVCGESETRSISKLTKPDNSESEDPADSSSSESESNSNKPTDSNLPDTSSNTDNAVDSNSSKIQDKPVADTGSNSNPLTGAAAPAAMLGITALGVLITSKKKK